MKRLETILIYLWAPFANLLWYLYTVLLGTASLLVTPFDRAGAMRHACARLWCRLIALTIGVRVRVLGEENLAPHETYVYMANHASLVDIPALFVGLPYQFRIMAKKELFYVPFLGWHLWAAGNFAVDRSRPSGTARSLLGVIEGVRGGKSLAVFPEGMRSADGRLQQFKAGAFKIAVRAGVPIVPVAIRGTHYILPKGSLAPRPGRVDVIIGRPIETRACGDERIPKLIEQTRAAIAASLDRAKG